MVSSGEIKQRLGNKREGKVIGGYLVCDKCGGYYELQEGESPEDFGDCECGGKLNHKKIMEIETDSEFICPECGTKNPEKADFCAECGVSLHPIQEGRDEAIKNESAKRKDELDIANKKIGNLAKAILVWGIIFGLNLINCITAVVFAILIFKTKSIKALHAFAIIYTITSLFALISGIVTNSPLPLIAGLINLPFIVYVFYRTQKIERTK